MFTIGWMQHIQQRQLDVRNNCMISIVTRPNSNRFLTVGTPVGAHLCSPSQDYCRSHDKISSSCDNGQCQYFKACSRECSVVLCHLSWNWQKLLWTVTVTTMCPWFDYLIACTIWQEHASCKPNITGCMLHNISYFFFQWGIRLWALGMWISFHTVHYTHC